MPDSGLQNPEPDLIKHYSQVLALSHLTHPDLTPPIKIKFMPNGLSLRYIVGKRKEGL